MKKKFKILQIISILAFGFLPLFSLAQDWGGERPMIFWDHWSVNVNAGATSYFGDLSYHDSDIRAKLSNESGPAFGLLLTKYFSKKIGISGQLLYGNLKGGNSNRITFDTQLLEYNIQGSVDFIHLLFPQITHKFGIEGHLGIGNVLFRSVKYENNEGEQAKNEHRARVPEFVGYAGAGMHYHIAEKFAVTADFSLRQLWNDKLDNLVKNNDFDYYTYFSVGITYYIDSLLSEPLRNKARLANASVRR